MSNLEEFPDEIILHILSELDGLSLYNLYLANTSNHIGDLIIGEITNNRFLDTYKDMLPVLDLAITYNDTKMIDALLNYEIYDTIPELEYHDKILYKAAKHGYLNIIKYLINLYDGIIYSSYYDKIIYVAAKNNHYEIVDYLLGKLPRNTYVPKRDEYSPTGALRSSGLYKLYEEGLKSAIKGAVSTGNIEKYRKYVPGHIWIKKENREKLIDHETAFLACMSGNNEIINDFLKHDPYDLGSVITDCAIKQDDIELLDFIDEMGRSLGANYILREAARAGNLEIVGYAIFKGADDLNGALSNVIRTYYPNLDVFNYLVENGADDFKGAFMDAVKSDNYLEGVKFLAENYMDRDDILEGLQTAIDYENTEIIEYLDSLIGMDDM